MGFEGVYSIIPTAFTDSGEFDPASQRKVVDLFVRSGINGLTALGVTGEVARLEEHERASVLQSVRPHETIGLALPALPPMPFQLIPSRRKVRT